PVARAPPRPRVPPILPLPADAGDGGQHLGGRGVVAYHGVEGIEATCRHWQHEVAAQLGLHDLKPVMDGKAAGNGWVAVDGDLGVATENAPSRSGREPLPTHQHPDPDAAPPPVAA